MAEIAAPGISGLRRRGPLIGLEWLIASRYLRSRRREAFISVIAGFSFLGIMLGVATLIIVMAVMNGFRAQLFAKILGVQGHVLVQPIDTPFTDYAAVAARIEAVNGVTKAIPFVEGQTLVSGPTSSSGALVRGIRPQDFSRLGLVSQSVVLGSLAAVVKDGGVALGNRLARTLGVTVGDTVKLVTPNGPVTPFGVTPRIKTFPVRAIFEVGMSEYDASMMFMPLAAAQSYFDLPDNVTGIEVYLKNPDDVGALKPAIEAVAQRQVYLTDWRERNTTFFSALAVERNVMFLILTLIVIVAALNIVAGMTMLVKDKARDIAILRTMGATRGAILRVFVMTGMSIGVAGTAAGFVIGVIVCRNIEAIREFISWVTSTELFSPELYFLSQLPANMDTGETVTVILMALGLSFLATLYPAWRAAATDPVVALRSE